MRLPEPSSGPRFIEFRTELFAKLSSTDPFLEYEDLLGWDVGKDRIRLFARNGARIPTLARIHDLPVTVVEIDEIVMAAGSSVLGGDAIGTSVGYTGTASCLVCSVVDPTEAYLLTCSHLFGPSPDVLAPITVAQLPVTGKVIATLTARTPLHPGLDHLNLVDGAIARVNDIRQVTHGVRDLPLSAEPVLLDDPWRDGGAGIETHERDWRFYISQEPWVSMYGGASKLRHGRVRGWGELKAARWRLPDGTTSTLRFVAQLLVEPAGGKPAFAEQCDSGAITVDERGKPLGIVIACAGRFTWVCPIHRILAALNVAIVGDPAPG